jgi:hypothetical protein
MHNGRKFNPRSQDMRIAHLGRGRQRMPAAERMNELGRVAFVHSVLSFVDGHSVPQNCDAPSQDNLFG